MRNCGIEGEIKAVFIGDTEIEMTLKAKNRLFSGFSRTPVCLIAAQGQLYLKQQARNLYNKPAVYSENLSRYVFRGRGGEEAHCRGYLVGAAHAPERYALNKIVKLLYCKV